MSARRTTVAIAAALLLLVSACSGETRDDDPVAIPLLTPTALKTSSAAPPAASTGTTAQARASESAAAAPGLASKRPSSSSGAGATSERCTGPGGFCTNADKEPLYPNPVAGAKIFTYDNLSRSDTDDRWGSNNYHYIVEPRRGDLQRIGRAACCSDMNWLEHRWSGSRVEWLSSQTGSFEKCTYSPPVLGLKLPLTAGDSWKTSTRCTHPSKRSLDYSATFSFQVLSEASRQVAGYGTLKVWRIRTVLDAPVEGMPELITRVTVTRVTDYSPKLLVPVSETEEQRNYKGSTVTSSTSSKRTLRAP